MTPAPRTVSRIGRARNAVDPRLRRVRRVRERAFPAKLGPWLGPILAGGLGLYYLFVEWIAPRPFYGLQYDPEMPYFINSLALFKGVSYSYIDHPGTPVEVIGSLLLALTRPWTRGLAEFFIPYHLAHPQLFLALAHGVIALFSLGCVLLLARAAVARSTPGAMVAGAAAAVAYFALDPPATFKLLTIWSHNAFAFPFGTLALLWLVLRLRKQEPFGPLTALGAGVAAGLLTSVQLYFLAWGVGTVVAIGVFTWLRREAVLEVAGKILIAILGIGLGFFLGFEPVLHRFREFYLWVDRLVFHQGRYGTGPSGITTPGQWIDNLIWVWNHAGPTAFLGTALILGLVFVAMWTRGGPLRRHPAWWAASLALTAQLAVLWLAIGKHPGVPYLLPVAATLPLLLALALEVLLREKDWRGGLAKGGEAVVFAAFAVGTVIAGLTHLRGVDQIALADQAISREIRAFSQRSGVDEGELTILWGYGVPSRCFALRFGDGYAGRSLQDEISAVCPDQWSYDVFGGYVELPHAYEALAANDDWDLLVVPERFRPPPSANLGLVHRTGVLSEGYGEILVITRASE